MKKNSERERERERVKVQNTLFHQSQKYMKTNINLVCLHGVERYVQLGGVRVRVRVRIGVRE